MLTSWLRLIPQAFSGVALFVFSVGPASAQAIGPGPVDTKKFILVPATIDEQLEINGDAVSAKILRTRMSVAVTIGEHGPYNFIVDSGADRTVVGEKLARELSLEPAGAAQLQSIAGLSRVETVRLPKLIAGRTEALDIIAPVLRDRDLGAAGILGIDALAGQRLLLDFDRNKITFEDPNRRAASAAPGEIVVVARRRRGQLIMTAVRTAGSSISAVIDTGSEATIGNMALLARLKRQQRVKFLAPATLTAVTGEKIIAQAAYVRELAIGRARLRDVLVVFADLPPFRLFGLADKPALLLGTDLLSSFSRVGLDFGRRRVRFQLRR